MSQIRKAIRDPRRAAEVAREKLLGRYVALQNARRGQPGPAARPSGLAALREVQEHALERSDINEHLPTIFVESLRRQPRLIVELGVRGGESTFVFERVARLSGATLVSVDIEDCTRASSYEGWHFVREDDVRFAQRFPAYCAELGVEPQIDVLFIDTSHEYEHTRQEIAAWWPHLADEALVLFHDTNMGELFRRSDGSLGHGWDNERGVIRAIEEQFGQKFDEKVHFVHYEPGWILRHHPHCNGLSILEKSDLG